MAAVHSMQWNDRVLLCEENLENPIYFFYKPDDS